MQWQKVIIKVGSGKERDRRPFCIGVSQLILGEVRP